MSDVEIREHHIAVIGMAGRFPGARNVEQFWLNLRDGVDCVTFFTDEELIAAGVAPALLRLPNYVRARAALEDIEMFDASFFGFNPREAAMIDPQQRLFLEHAWEALEHGGYDAETFDGAIGVFGGAGVNTYYQSNLRTRPELEELVGGFQSMIANDKDFLTSRVSYKMNLKGPAVTTQTACSTSLVAIHLACQSVLNGECDMALAGGVSAGVPQKVGYLYREGGIASPDGHCRAFDAGAGGTVGGNGVGVVLLKRLVDAVADGDSIYSVIKGSAINNDGSLKVGFTAPSIEGQAQVIADAMAMANVDPDTMSYIEAHGTGTSLGDPIEVAALTRAFRSGTDRKGFCALGSVKTGIGHLGSASGVAGFIKTVLSLQHRQIPPSLNFETPNPEIDFENSPFYVNTKLSAWKNGETRRRAGISSFGIGGTNAHVILEEPPASEPSGVSLRPSQLLFLSAKTETALRTLTSNLAAHLKQHPELNLADVAYTCMVGRATFSHRQALVCKDIEDAASALASLDPARFLTGYREQENAAVVFMFSGQGTQYVNMGREYYEIEPVFREAVDACAELLVSHLGFDLRDALFADEQSSTQAATKLEETRIAQPALFTIEYAMAQLWMSWGIKPAAMIGHSLGEYVAACLAGVMSLPDALALVAARGRLMQELPAGAMSAVPLSEKELEPLDERLSIAAVNGSSLCVVSGVTEAIAALENQLATKGITCRRLHTSHAFHSEMMRPIMGSFAEALRRVELKPPNLPYISNVTGTWVNAAEATDPAYWTRHLRETVRFADGLSHLLQDGDYVLLEVGPGSTLGALAKRHPAHSPASVALPSMRRPGERPGYELLLNTFGSLWLAGVKIAGDKFFARERRGRIALPTYPFERQRHWIEPAKNGSASNSVHAFTEDREAGSAHQFYLPIWSQSVLPVMRRPQLASGQRDRSLIFLDEYGIGTQLAARLTERGENVINVTASDRYEQTGAHSYSLNPQRQDDYLRLLAQLAEQDQKVDRIICLWNVAATDPAAEEPDGDRDANGSELLSLFHLARALDGWQPDHALRIEIVTSDMQSVTGAEALSPERSALLGLCLVIPQEYPRITCRSIDVTAQEIGTWREQELIACLSEELMTLSPDPHVAYRGNRRWTRNFTKAATGDGERPSRLREHGRYVMLGALDGAGYALAEYLAQTFRPLLILLEPDELPAREQWAQWLFEKIDHPVSRKLKRVLALEESGAEVLVKKVDPLDQRRMREVISEAQERFGHLHGAIYLPRWERSLLSRPLRETDPRDAQSSLERCAAGLRILEQELRGRELDFCILGASLDSVTGGRGRALSAAAHACMAAFAQQQNQRGLTNWVCVNWDDWKHDSQEKPEVVINFVSPDLSSAEANVASKHVLSCGPLAQVIVLRGDLHRRIEQAALQTAAAIPLEVSAGAAHLHPRPHLPHPYVAPSTDLERRIAAIWEELLGVEKIGIHDGFYELGGHSLLATQLISRLKDAFPVDLPLLTIFRDVSTIAEMVEVVEEILIREIEALPEDEALSAL